MQIFKKRPPLKLRVDDPSSIQLRPYNRATDYQGVIDMIESRFPEVGISLDLEGADIALTDIQKYWREPGGEFVVLTRNDEILGSLAARPIKGKQATAEFASFFLRKKHEGKGLGLLLLKWGFEWCTQNKIQIIEMWSNEDRPRAHRLYHKIGFTSNGIKKPYREAQKSQHQLYFELDLFNPKKRAILEQMTQQVPF